MNFIKNHQKWVIAGHATMAVHDPHFCDLINIPTKHGRAAHQK